MSATCSVPVPAPFATNRTSSLSLMSAMALAMRVLGAAGLLISHLVLARGLGVAGFGEYAQAIAWVQFLCVFGKLGLDNASLRYVSEYVTQGEAGNLRSFLADSTTASFLASAAAMACLNVAAFVFWNSIGAGLASCLIVASTMIPLISLRQIQEASLRGIGRIFESQASTTVWPFLLFVMAAIVWSSSSTRMSSATATLLHLISVVVVSILVYSFLRQSRISGGIPDLRVPLHQPVDGDTSDEMLRPGKARRDRVRDDRTLATNRRRWAYSASAFLVFELLIALKSRIGTVVAGQCLGNDSAGLYAAMERFADISVLGSQSLGMVIAPQFATLFAAGRYPEMRRLMTRSQILGLAFAVPAALGFACFGDFLFLLLGSNYRAGWNVLLALLTSTCIAAFASPGAYVLQMTGRERTLVAITGVCAITNILFSLVFIWSFGILGLGISQILTSLVWAAGVQFSLRQHPVWESTAAVQASHDFVTPAEESR